MIKFRSNCKSGEGRSQETKGAQKHANSLACENFATKIAPLRNKASSVKLFRSPRLSFGKSRFRYEKGPPLQNYFAAQAPPPAKYPFGTWVPFLSPNHHFATAKRLWNPLRLHFTAQAPSTKPFRSCETHPWHTSACEIGSWLRNEPPPAKISTVTQIPI